MYTYKNHLKPRQHFMGSHDTDFDKHNMALKNAQQVCAKACVCNKESVRESVCESERVRERVSVCVRECVWDRNRVCVAEFVCVCEGDSVCMCVRESVCEGHSLRAKEKGCVFV